MFPIRDHNPSERLPVVTWTLIAANVAIFLACLPLYGDERALAMLYWEWGLVPAKLSSGTGYHGVITSMFLHAGFLHLGGNMLFLWIFGDNLEDRLGHLGFLGFYLATGLGAALVQFAGSPVSPVPMVGASGAIAGVMGGYLLLFPRARVDVLFILIVFFRILPVPAWLVLGVWFAIQFVSGVSSPVDGEVAYWAHAGGFAAGFLAIVPTWLRAGGTRFWARTHGHPDHPEARYRLSESSVPRVRRRK